MNFYKLVLILEFSLSRAIQHSLCEYRPLEGDLFVEKGRKVILRTLTESALILAALVEGIVTGFFLAFALPFSFIGGTSEIYLRIKGRCIDLLSLIKESGKKMVGIYPQEKKVEGVIDRLFHSMSHYWVKFEIDAVSHYMDQYISKITGKSIHRGAQAVGGMFSKAILMLASCVEVVATAILLLLSTLFLFSKNGREVFFKLKGRLVEAFAKMVGEGKAVFDMQIPSNLFTSALQMLDRLKGYRKPVALGLSLYAIYRLSGY